MKKLVSLLVVMIALVFATIALARGAPDKKAFVDQAVVSVHVAPTVANVPPMTDGFDVIQNNSTAAIRVGSAQSITSAQARQSTTGDEDNLQSASTVSLARSGPHAAIVLLA